MKITKYVHSCLLIEDTDYTVLIDPGVFSWESGLFDPSVLARLDAILITHEHADHMSVPFIQAVRQRFPTVPITTTPHAMQPLQAAGIENVATTTPDKIELLATNHEALGLIGPTPENTGFHVLGKLTHPGDSHHFATSKAVLALPVTAPWGSLAEAMALGYSLRPQYIIPIHDWHWNATAREMAYENLAQFYGQHGITFIKPQDGVAFEV